MWSKVEFVTDDFLIPSSLIITYIHYTDTTFTPAISGVTADACIPRPGKHSFFIIFYIYSAFSCEFTLTFQLLYPIRVPFNRVTH